MIGKNNFRSISSSRSSSSRSSSNVNRNNTIAHMSTVAEPVKWHLFSCFGGTERESSLRLMREQYLIDFSHTQAHMRNLILTGLFKADANGRRLSCWKTFHHHSNQHAAHFMFSYFITFTGGVLLSDTCFTFPFKQNNSTVKDEVGWNFLGIAVTRNPVYRKKILKIQTSIWGQGWLSVIIHSLPLSLHYGYISILRVVVKISNI